MKLTLFLFRETGKCTYAATHTALKSYSGEVFGGIWGGPWHIGFEILQFRSGLGAHLGVQSCDRVWLWGGIVVASGTCFVALRLFCCGLGLVVDLFR